MRFSQFFNESISLEKDANGYYLKGDTSSPELHQAIRRIGFRPDFKLRRWFTDYVNNDTIRDLAKLGIQIGMIDLKPHTGINYQYELRSKVTPQGLKYQIIGATRGDRLFHTNLKKSGWYWSMRDNVWTINPEMLYANVNGVENHLNVLDKQGVHIPDEVRQQILSSRP